MPIWDTVVRSGADPAMLSRATHLFVGNEGPFYTGHRHPHEPSSFTSPRLVTSMLGEEQTSTSTGLMMLVLIGGITIGIFASTLLMHPKKR